MSKNYYIIPIFVPHKGCPHDCIFCNQKKITGCDEDNSIENIRDTIESYLKTIPCNGLSIVEVAFYGGSFTAIPIKNQTTMLKLAKQYIDSGKINHIRISTRPDYINDEILQNLKKYSVSIIELGVQSMDEEVLRLSQRGHTAEDVIKAIKLIRQYDFIVGVQIMVGLPSDNVDKCLQTTKILADLNPNIARIYPALVIKDTYMEVLYNKGQFKPLSLEGAVEICKNMLMILEKRGIEVIRIGLQPTENIELGKDVVAGPFHPSMRQLIDSSIYLDIMKCIIEKFHKPEFVNIIVNPKDVSNIIGQNKSNIKLLKTAYFINKISIVQKRHISLGTIIIDNGEKQIMMSKKDYYDEIKN